MLRVLMVLEDYGELMFLQTVLKKIGFDVDAIQNPRIFSDSLLRMNPDVVVMTAWGKRVKGVEMSKHIKRVRGLPHVIQIHQPGQPKDEDPMINAWLESPVPAVTLLHTIADLCNLNKQVLSEKFSKLRLSETPEEQNRILHLQGQEGEPKLERSKETGGNFETQNPPVQEPSSTQSKNITETTMTSADRDERYKKFTEEPPDHVGFSVKSVQQQIKALRKLENPQDLADLERERKAFVEHLFNKKKSG